MFQPARLKRAIVASCRLPLGIPRRSLLATGDLRFLARCDWTREATDGAFVTNEAVSFDDDSEQQRIVVAICGGRNDAEAVSAGFAFHPEFLPRATPESDEA